MSNLRVTEIGSASAEVAWDSVSEGTIYSLQLQDDQGDTIVSVDTEETSATFQDMTPNTNYVFKLLSIQNSVKYTKIRLDHYRKYWLGIVEVRVYDSNGNHMSADKFGFSSSKEQKHTAAADAMNGMDNTEMWNLGSMLDFENSFSWFLGSNIQPNRTSIYRIT